MDARIRKKINKIKSTKQLTYKTSGCFGLYYKLTHKIGVKVLKDHAYSFYITARYSKAWDEAVKEMDLCNEVHNRTKMSPKIYCVRVIRDEEKQYRVAIFMEHIKGTQLEDSHGDKYYTEKGDLVREIMRHLNKHGISHADLNWSNILIKNRGKKIDIANAMVIDFTPYHVTITDKK